MTDLSKNIVREALQALHGEEIVARMNGEQGAEYDAIKAAKKALDHLLLVEFAHSK